MTHWKVLQFEARGPCWTLVQKQRLEDPQLPVEEEEVAWKSDIDQQKPYKQVELTSLELNVDEPVEPAIPGLVVGHNLVAVLQEPARTRHCGRFGHFALEGPADRRYSPASCAPGVKMATARGLDRQPGGPAVLELPVQPLEDNQEWKARIETGPSKRRAIECKRGRWEHQEADEERQDVALPDLEVGQA